MNHMFYYYQMPGTNSSPFVGNTSAVQSPSTSDSTGQTLPSLSSLPMKQAPSIPSSAFSNGSLSNSPKLLHVPSPSFAPTSQFLPPQNNQGFQPNTISQSQSLLKSATLGSLMQHHSPQTNNIDTRQQQTQQILQRQQQLQQQQQQQQQLAANQFLQAMNSSFSNGAMGMLKASPAGLSTNLSYQHQFGSPVQQSLVQPHVSTLNSLSSISPADVFHATLLSGVQGNTLTQVAAPVDAAAVSTPKKPFQCNMCHKSFRDKNGFRSHMRIHTGEKPYECKECGRKFRDRSNLTRHTRTHTGDRPFPCTYCPKRFAHKHHLVDHLRTHTKEKPFTCMICSKSFSVKSTLKKHLTTHSNQKPHTCPHCSRCFSRRDYLGRHVDFCHCNPEVIKARESQAQERAAAAASSSSSTTTSTNN